MRETKTNKIWPNALQLSHRGAKSLRNLESGSRYRTSRNRRKKMRVAYPKSRHDVELLHDSHAFVPSLSKVARRSSSAFRDYLSGFLFSLLCVNPANQIHNQPTSNRDKKKKIIKPPRTRLSLLPWLSRLVLRHLFLYLRLPPSFLLLSILSFPSCQIRFVQDTSVNL